MSNKLTAERKLVLAFYPPSAVLRCATAADGYGSTRSATTRVVAAFIRDRADHPYPENERDSAMLRALVSPRKKGRGNEEHPMCIHSLDGLHGWTPESRAILRAACAASSPRSGTPSRRGRSRLSPPSSRFIVAVWLVASLVCALLIFWAAARGRQTNGGQQ